MLGNGDVMEAFDALRMVRATKCDGVIVGRGCLGRPWLFRERAEVLSGRAPPPPPRLGEVVAILLRHAELLVELFGPHFGVLEMRKWCGWYLKGFPHSGPVRNTLFRAQSLEEVRSVVSQLHGDEPYPVGALRARRCKRNGVQKVALPDGYLDSLDDDVASEETVAGELAASDGG